jgi:diguanylate cyclase (GGDEF)-like protein/PAS domain S-box-containing protein
MFSKLSLRYRIALVIFLLEVCMLASVLGVTLTQSRQTAIDFNAASQKASLDLLSNLSITALLTSEYSDYQLYIQDIEKQPSLQRIVLADYRGQVVAGSKVTDVGHFLKKVVKESEPGWQIQPVNTAAGPLGTLAVQFSDEELTVAYQKTRNLAVLLAITGMIIIALVGLVTGFALTSRLTTVTEAASRFAGGDHAARSLVSGQDEVALLSNSVNLMANAIGEKERQLSEQGDYIKLLLDSTSEGIFGVDSADICTFINPACLRMLGYKNENELIGKSIHELIHHSFPDGQPYPKEQCRVRLATLQGQATHVDDEVHWRADGSSFPVEYWSQPMYRDGKLVGTVVTFIDITERKESEEQIRNLAYFDPLTQLPNRRLLMDRLSQALISSTRTHEFGALLILDLDNFKVLNDTQGHDVGDQLLIEVAKRLLGIARLEDTVSRLGGDEYVVIVEHLGTEQNAAVNRAKVIAEKIHRELNLPYILTSSNRYSHHSTPSIGLTLFHGQELACEILLKQADVALYQAKGSGRNAIRFFNPEMQAAIESRSAMETAMRNGIGQGEFQLFYQPQVDNHGRMIGAEALMRWFPANQEQVYPDQFIPLAEDTALIVPLGLWVLQTACAQLKAWEKDQQTSALQIAINVSARQFHQPDFFEQIRDSLKNSGVNPALLKLELTESVVLENVEDVINRMLKIKALGVAFSLDDFGTGFSSLSYLKRLPLDQVKIDQSFVRDLTSDPNDAAIVSAIIAMCHTLGMQIIAEGVETRAQLEFLKERGCTRYQGYLFGKPMPVEELSELIYAK